jgi:hypothetical protein
MTLLVVQENVWIFLKSKGEKKNFWIKKGDLICTVSSTFIPMRSFNLIFKSNKERGEVG